MKKRKEDRFVRRLEVEFSAEGKNYRAISSDLSKNGLFIRTNHAFAAGTLLDIHIYLPGGSSCRVKGFVRRALKTPIVSIKNGMGIELTETDDCYTRFLEGFSSSAQGEERKGAAGAETAETQTQDALHDEYLIIRCANCNIKNKVNKSKMALSLKCGKCRHPLVIQG